MDVLDEMNYDKEYLDKKLKELIEKSDFINKEEKVTLQNKLYFYLSENSYLKTIQANQY
jgi:arginine decarboxylase